MWIHIVQYPNCTVCFTVKWNYTMRNAFMIMVTKPQERIYVGDRFRLWNSIRMGDEEVRKWKCGLYSASGGCDSVAGFCGECSEFLHFSKAEIS